jgi:hypothetical protein
MNPDRAEYLSLTEAAKLCGVSRRSLARRLDRGLAPDFVLASDTRVRLIRKCDLQELAFPRPQPRSRKQEAAGVAA